VATERTTKKQQAFCGVTTKGLAANEQPPQHIMAAHGEKVRRTGQILGTSALGQAEGRKNFDDSQGLWVLCDYVGVSTTSKQRQKANTN